MSGNAEGVRRRSGKCSLSNSVWGSGRGPEGVRKGSGWGSCRPLSDPFKPLSDPFQTPVRPLSDPQNPFQTPFRPLSDPFQTTFTKNLLPFPTPKQPINPAHSPLHSSFPEFWFSRFQGSHKPTKKRLSFPRTCVCQSSCQLDLGETQATSAVKVAVCHRPAILKTLGIRTL